MVLLVTKPFKTNEIRTWHAQNQWKHIYFHSADLRFPWFLVTDISKTNEITISYFATHCKTNKILTSQLASTLKPTKYMHFIQPINQPNLPGAGLASEALISLKKYIICKLSFWSPSKPDSQPASQPVSQPASQPTDQLEHQLEDHQLPRCTCTSRNWIHLGRM